MRAAAEFHGIAVKRSGFATDLHNTDLVTVLVSKELKDVIALGDLVMGYLNPAHRSILQNAPVNQLLDILDLLRGKRLTIEVEGQFIRPYIRTFLGDFRTGDFMKRPV